MVPSEVVLHVESCRGRHPRIFFSTQCKFPTDGRYSLQNSPQYSELSGHTRSQTSLVHSKVIATKIGHDSLNRLTSGNSLP